MGSSDGDSASVNRPSSEPTVLVTGLTGRLLASVALRLLEARVDSSDGLVVVAPETAPDRVVQRLGRSADVNRDALVVVSRLTGGPQGTSGGWVRQISPACSPTSIDREVRDSLAWLADRGIERRHFLFDSLMVGAQFSNPESVYELAYELAMTVGTEDGLGIFVVESTGLSADDVNRLGHLFDVHVKLQRGETGPELRWTGLLGGSDGWRPVQQVDFAAIDFW